MVAPRPAPPAQLTWHTTDKWPNLGPLCFRLGDLPDQQFMLIFPEWLTARQQNWHVRPTWQTRHHSATGTWHSDGIRLTLSLRFQVADSARRLNWEYLVHNTSDTTLTDVAVFNCFNLVDAPLFQDLTLERTVVSTRQGQVRQLAGVQRVKAPRTLQFYPARGGLNLPRFERFSRYQATSPEELTGNRIVVRSRDGRWTVETSVDGQVAYFFANTEPDHGCVHAAPLLGTIKAGGKVRVRGAIVFRPVPRP